MNQTQLNFLAQTGQIQNLAKINYDILDIHTNIQDQNQIKQVLETLNFESDKGKTPNISDILEILYDLQISFTCTVADHIYKNRFWKPITYLKTYFQVRTFNQFIQDEPRFTAHMEKQKFLKKCKEYGINVQTL